MRINRGNIKTNKNSTQTVAQATQATDSEEAINGNDDSKLFYRRDGTAKPEVAIGKGNL